MHTWHGSLARLRTALAEEARHDSHRLAQRVLRDGLRVSAHFDASAGGDPVITYYLDRAGADVTPEDVRRIRTEWALQGARARLTPLVGTHTAYRLVPV